MFCVGTPDCTFKFIVHWRICIYECCLFGWLGTTSEYNCCVCASMPNIYLGQTNTHASMICDLDSPCWPGMLQLLLCLPCQVNTSDVHCPCMFGSCNTWITDQTMQAGAQPTSSQDPPLPALSQQCKTELHKGRQWPLTKFQHMAPPFPPCKKCTSILGYTSVLGSPPLTKTTKTLTFLDIQILTPRSTYTSIDTN